MPAGAPGRSRRKRPLSKRDTTFLSQTEFPRASNRMVFFEAGRIWNSLALLLSSRNCAGLRGNFAWVVSVGNRSHFRPVCCRALTSGDWVP